MLVKNGVKIMNHRIQIYVVIGILATPLMVQATNVITFFIRPYPEPIQFTYDQARTKITDHHTNVARRLLKHTLKKEPTVGIFGSYMGYLQPSNRDGQLTFPRSQQGTEVKLLITPLIRPVMMIGNTVHHWVTIDEYPAELYSIEREQDSETKLYYWNTQKIPLPENKRISLDTIIIFAKPTSIFVPTGITITENSPHLILPDIYARKEINSALDALRILKIRPFYSTVPRAYKKLTDTDYAELPL
jgi:hypothetical protein